MDAVHPITIYRWERGLTLQAFGELFGVDKSTVKRWESGRISAERARAVAELTGVSLAKLRPDLWPAPSEHAADSIPSPEAAE